MALAWLRGELTLAEIAQARGKFNASNSLAWVAPRLKAALQAGRLAIKEDAAALMVRVPARDNGEPPLPLDKIAGG